MATVSYDTWNRWVTYYPTSTSITMSTAANTAWRYWNTGTTTYATSTSNVVWDNWNTTATHTPLTSGRIIYDHAYAPPTPEEVARQRAEYAEREETRRIAVEKTKARLVVAQDRAMDTLRMVLSRDEVAGLDLDDELIVTGSDGERYLIGTHGVAGNVVRVDEHGCRLESYCCHPSMGWGDDQLPNADGWIAQVLAIKHAAEYFLGKANVSNRSRRCTVPVEAIQSNQCGATRGSMKDGSIVVRGRVESVSLVRNPTFEVVHP